MASASRHLSRNLDGDLTELLVQTYADRVLVLVTQMGKVGTLVPSIC
jgi:proteasome assembly chaperone 3